MASEIQVQVNDDVHYVMSQACWKRSAWWGYVLISVYGSRERLETYDPQSLFDGIVDSLRQQHGTANDEDVIRHIGRDGDCTIRACWEDDVPAVMSMCSRGVYLERKAVANG